LHTGKGLLKYSLNYGAIVAMESEGRLKLAGKTKLRFKKASKNPLHREAHNAIIPMQHLACN
jgi:hypothetical protein